MSDQANTPGGVRPYTLSVPSNWKPKPQPPNPFEPCELCATRGFVLMKQEGFGPARCSCGNCGGKGWVLASDEKAAVDDER